MRRKDGSHTESPRLLIYCWKISEARIRAFQSALQYQCVSVAELLISSAFSLLISKIKYGTHLMQL